MNNLPKNFEVRNVIKLELDREKIERVGEYYYEDLVEYLDREFGEQGFRRDRSCDELVYYSDERNNFLKQMVCYSRVVDEPAIYDYLKSYVISEYRNSDIINPVMYEDYFETLARHGGQMPG